MTNNLKAELTLTAEELQDLHALATDREGAYPGMLGNISNYLILDPSTVKAMASMALKSLSTQQPMGEVTDEMVHRASVAMNIGFRDFHVPERVIKRALIAALHPNQERGE